MRQKRVNNSEPKGGLPRPASLPQEQPGAYPLEINQDVQTLLKRGAKTLIGWSNLVLMPAQNVETCLLLELYPHNTIKIKCTLRLSPHMSFSVCILGH